MSTDVKNDENKPGTTTTTSVHNDESTLLRSHQCCRSPPRFVHIFASQVASLLGRHKYQSQWQTITEVWRRTWRDNFKIAAAHLPGGSYQDDDERAQQLLSNKFKQLGETVQQLEAEAKKSGDFSQLVPSFEAALLSSSCPATASNDTSQTSLISCSTSTSVSTSTPTSSTPTSMSTPPSTNGVKSSSSPPKSSASSSSADLPLPQSTKPLVASADTTDSSASASSSLPSPSPVDEEVKLLQQTVRKRRRVLEGIVTEPQVAKEHAVVDGNRTLFAKVYRQRVGGGWGICGRVDGFQQANGKLVEIKRRIHRFLTPLPLYDQTQCQCYMDLLDLDNCVLMETCGKETKETQLQFDAADWQKCVEELDQVVTRLRKLAAADETTQQKWLTLLQQKRDQDMEKLWQQL